jgi:tetratricopeptide (TPR) repeat protein
VITRRQVVDDALVAMISVKKASAERLVLFAGEEGYLKADEYLEAGKFAIAGEGYLAFLQKHPNHPDAHDIMKKATEAFVNAGYLDKAIWVQGEMMKAFPTHPSDDLMDLAKLEKDAGRYDDAIDHALKAAEAAPSAEEALWWKLYWAWFVQIRDGNQAGISAVQQVQQEITSSGVTNPALAERAALRLTEYQQQLVKTGR